MWVLWGFGFVSPSSRLKRLQAHLPSLGLFVWLRDSLAPEKCPAAESTQQTFCMVCSHRGHRRGSAQLARGNRRGLKWPGYKVRRESDPQFCGQCVPTCNKNLRDNCKPEPSWETAFSFRPLQPFVYLCLKTRQ